MIFQKSSEHFKKKSVSSRRCWSRYPIACFANWDKSIPCDEMVSSLENIFSLFHSFMSWSVSLIIDSQATHKNLATFSSLRSHKILTWSTYFTASLTHHSEIFDIILSADSVYWRFSCLQILSRWETIALSGTFL